MLLISCLLVVSSVLAQPTWNSINVIHVTDVHGWVSGHKHEPYYDADYGHFASFLEHLQATARSEGRDLFIFDSGDLSEGTGLSDASEIRCEYLWPIIREIPLSALTIGNHELYDATTSQHMIDSGFISHWEGRYLTSNVQYESGQKIGEQFTIIKGEFGTTLGVIGFLYNMVDADPLVFVSKVQDELESDWFVAVMSESVDAYVCLVHMDVGDSLVTTINNAIRDIHPTIPVLFLAGHTHYRSFRRMDDHTASIISGRYFDTAMFVSFNNSLPDRTWFEYNFVDTSISVMSNFTNVDENNFLTDHGKYVQEVIAESRNALGLDEVLGCSPVTYRRSSDMGNTDSLWSLYVDEVVPTILFDGRSNQFHMASTGGLRYDLYQGDYTIDDAYTLSPFRNEFLYVPNILGSDLLALVDDVQSLDAHIVMRGRIDEWAVSTKGALPNYATTALPSATQRYDFVFTDYDESVLLAALSDITGETYESSNYATPHDSSTVWVDWGYEWSSLC